MNRRRVIWICSISLIVILLAGLVCWIISSRGPETYSTAKVECEKVLQQGRTEMENIAVDALKSDEMVAGFYKGRHYHYVQEGKTVRFNVDSQGMLGGQYWGLVYSEDGTLFGATETYLYQEPDGNNIVRAERLDAHWWYLWEDYDGRDLSFQ